MIYAQSASSQTLSLPNVPPKDQWVGTQDFSGGINNFVTADRLLPTQEIDVLNFLPYGSSLALREGTQKIFFTGQGAIWGLSFADSANTVQSILVVAGSNLYQSNSSTGWELAGAGTAGTSIGATTAIPTYFATTPFGTVVVNGTDSARIWQGKQPYTGLGLCITDTCDTATDIGIHDGSSSTSADTIRIRCIESRMEADYWIGYWVRKLDGNFRQIIDNGVNWITYVGDSSGTDIDTISRTAKFYIVCRPDSVSGGLIYPKGQACAYYKDRLFVSSAFYPWRIYYSNTRLINDIDPDAFINLDLEAYDKIQTMVVFNGYLIVFTKYAVYAIGESGSDFIATPITKLLGAIAPYSVAAGDDYIYFCSARGIYRFKGNIYGSLSYTMEKISDAVNPIIENINIGDWSTIGGYYGDRQYWFSYNSDSSLVFDERTNGWFKQSFGFTVGKKYSGVFGTITSATLYPTGDGTTLQWTTSTGTTHYSLIDDKTNETDYIYTSVVNKSDYFTMQDLTLPTSAPITQVTFWLRCKKGGYQGTDIITLKVIANGTTYDIGSINLTYGVINVSMLSTTNPVTGLAWTDGDLDSLVLCIYHPSGTMNDDYVYGLWAEVSFAGSSNAPGFLICKPSGDYVYQYGGTCFDDTATTGTSITGVPVKG